MKHKPVLIRKILLEKENEQKVNSTQEQKINFIDDVQVQNVSTISNNESSVSISILDVILYFLEKFFTKYIFILFILYFLLRFLGMDVYPPFGDKITSWIKRASDIIQFYLLN